MKFSLSRRGAWLFTQTMSWQMAGVHGPLALDHAEEERQYFHILTTSHEVLLVSRRADERGMRELRLDSIMSQ